VCEAVSRRASMMASAGITALLKKMDYKAGRHFITFGQRRL